MKRNVLYNLQIANYDWNVVVSVILLKGEKCQKK